MNDLSILVGLGCFVGAFHALGKEGIIPKYGYTKDFPPIMKFGVAATVVASGMTLIGVYDWRLGLSLLGAWVLSQWATEAIVELVRGY